MKMKNFFVLLLAALLVALPAAFAHETSEPHDEGVLNPGAGLSELLASAFGLVLVVGVASAVLGERLGDSGKKAAFAVIATISIAATFYLIYSVYVLFSTSATGGPVHWHADFEVWACGERISLKKASGWSTRVGPILLHHHGDDRMHIEGVVRKLEDVSLREFFKAIGGEFKQSELTVITENGELKNWRNGDSCPEGLQGSLKFFVNGKPNADFGNYVISKHTDVPPGDVIKIVFDSSQ